MSQKLIVQDWVIVVVTKNHSPSILNLDFLKCSGIIPQDWNLAHSPTNTNSGTQLTFTNGVNIIAEFNRVMFIESIRDKEIESLEIPGIAHRYAQTLPNVEYEAVGINPRGHISFAGEQDSAREYITETLLSPGAWQSEGEAPMRASLNLVYKFNRAPLYLNVTEASLRNEDETITPIVMFSGSFSYELSGESSAEKLSNLHQAIDNWQDDISTYSDIINTKFLTQKTENTLVVPDLFVMNTAAVS